MKKNLLLAIVGCGGMLLSANTAKAQEAVVVEESVVTEVPVECKTNYSTSWKDNWYIQLGAGMMVPYVDHYNVDHHAKRHITAIYNVGVGHWFSPYLGVRATGFYGKLHTDWVTTTRPTCSTATSTSSGICSTRSADPKPTALSASYLT